MIFDLMIEKMADLEGEERKGEALNLKHEI